MVRDTAERKRRGGWLLIAGLMFGGALSCQDDALMSKAESQKIKKVFRNGLASPEPTLRAETVRAIGIAGSAELSPLLQSALKDDHPLVRGSAALRQARFDPVETKSLIVDALTSDDERTRRIIVREIISGSDIRMIESDILDIALRSKDRILRQRALEHGLIVGLSTIKDEALRSRILFPKLSNLTDDPDPIIAGRAIRALHDSGRRERFEAVVEQLGRGSLKEQRRAIRVLAEAGLPESREALTRIANGPESKLRQEGRVALLALGESKWLETARDALGGAREAKTVHIIRALGAIKANDARRLMLSYREDARLRVRLAVQRSLGRHPKSEPEDFLRGLRDEDPRVAIAALRGLLSALPTHVPTVMRIELKDAERSSRALQVLVSALYEVEVDGDVRELDRLETQVQNLADELMPVLEKGGPFARAAAAELIFRRKDPMSIYKEIKDPAPEVQYALLDALAKSPPPEAPLTHVAFFRTFNRSELQSFQVLAAAGVWNAYRLSAAIHGQGQGEPVEGSSE